VQWQNGSVTWPYWQWSEMTFETRPIETGKFRYLFHAQAILTVPFDNPLLKVNREHMDKSMMVCDSA
jgi:hypothetical protein